MSAMDGFAEALLDPAQAVPKGLVDPEGRTAGKRFDVYRNNVVASLSRALAEGFPTIQSLVGTEFFNAMAGVYVRAHPPTDPRMMYFGAEMPAFLAAFGPVQHLAYLADIARLELGLRESYHAGDAQGLTAEVLASLPQDSLEELRFPMVPSARLISSGHPIFSVWTRARDPQAPAPVPGGQDILIARPGFDPEPHLLEPGMMAFFTALSQAASLSEAIAIAAQTASEFDPGQALALALSTEILEVPEVS